MPMLLLVELNLTLHKRVVGPTVANNEGGLGLKITVHCIVIDVCIFYLMTLKIAHCILSKYSVAVAIVSCRWQTCTTSNTKLMWR